MLYITLAFWFGRLGCPGAFDSHGKSELKLLFFTKLKRNRLSSKLINDNSVVAWQYLDSYLCRNLTVCASVSYECPVEACNWSLHKHKKPTAMQLRASASSFLRAEIISVPRLALQTNLLPYWKSLSHKKLTNSISMQSQFFARRRPRGTLQCVATRQAKAKTINWSNRLNCLKGLNGTRDKQVEFCGDDK